MTEKKAEPAIQNAPLQEVKNQQPSERNPFSGSRLDMFSTTMARQIANSIWVEDGDKDTIHRQRIAAFAGAGGVKPQDEVEGMLAAQMVAAHNATMECFKRAMIPEQSVDSRDYNLNHAAKLMRAYAGMMEALNRYRGKGQQKMTVEHVHIHAGGQAIVGQVSHPEGGGVILKTEEQPHAKHIDHAPMPEMPGADKKRQRMPVPRDA